MQSKKRYLMRVVIFMLFLMVSSFAGIRSVNAEQEQDYEITIDYNGGYYILDYYSLKNYDSKVLSPRGIRTLSNVEGYFRAFSDLDGVVLAGWKIDDSTEVYTTEQTISILMK